MYREIEKNEVLWENYKTEDAEIVVTAFGTVARVVKSAVDELRAEGVKVGLFRPISVWPFPTQALRDTVCRDQVKAVLDVEVNDGYKFGEGLLTVRGEVTADADVVVQGGFVVVTCKKASA